MKYNCWRLCTWMNLSPPVRGAWIEIFEVLYNAYKTAVAPREGGVD